MIIGHYATALLPYSKRRETPLWVFLLCANLTDFLWLFLALIGLETPTPSSLWTATFQNMTVSMPYSHDVVPVLILALLTVGVTYAALRHFSSALWCGLLVVGHELCDFLSGWTHYFFGPESLAIGFDFYHKAPHLALVIEAIFSVVFVFMYFRSEKKQGRDYSSRYQLLLYLFFIAGTLIWLPTATIPLGEMLRF